jgi:hypothetical protein
MNKKTSLIFLIVCLSVFIGGSFVYKRLFPSPKVHYHAGFVVFQNNKKLDFSDNKYMYIKPCAVNGKEDQTNVNPQMEKAHLHDNVGDVVHVEESGPVWRDLFINIKYSFTENDTTGYINGKLVKPFLSVPIHPDDSLVVFIGENDQSHLQDGVTSAYIEEMAKKSKACGE